MNIKDRIKAEGLALGFSFVGFTTPDPPEHYAAYTDWLDAGRHAGMQYLAETRSRERRADPKQILPECKTIIVLAAAYPNPLQFPPAQPDVNAAGRIASYAWTGADYHLVIPPLLEKLVAAIQKILDQPIRYHDYTDTGPILERDLAQRAGLGWIGKNTCLISPHLGSFHFLAEILIDQYIEPDSPFTTDRCGSCTKCIDACPTQCILPDRTIDASRCISYLTIENKGAIPAPLRTSLDNWVFGCDICQMVCPWNQKNRDASSASFFDRPGGPMQVDLKQEIQLSPAEFNHKFRHSAIKRAKRKGYLRNLAVALGNTRSPAFIDTIAQVLQTETEPLIRAHLVWALGNIGTGKAKEILLQLQSSEKDIQVKSEIDRALTECNSIE